MLVMYKEEYVTNIREATVCVNGVPTGADSQGRQPRGPTFAIVAEENVTLQGLRPWRVEVWAVEHTRSTAVEPHRGDHGAARPPGE